VAKHKFNIGQTVDFSAGFAGGSGKGRYTIVRLLPNEGDTPQYRIKSSRDGQERMVLESQLVRSAGSPGASLFAAKPVEKRLP
jgi:hypothetical protein